MAKLEELRSAELNHAGLNLQAVFNFEQLPPSLKKPISDLFEQTRFSQLILLGHSGRRLWEQVDQYPASNSKLSASMDEDPIDNYSIKVTQALLKKHYPEMRYQLLYPVQNPISQSIGLQQLGELVGWHAESPMRIGVNQQWGTWFAYRVALIAESQFKPTRQNSAQSPCTTCSDKPCISSCPAKALSEESFNMRDCIDYRVTPNSACQDRCIARLQCPVGREHQYNEEQIQYHYGHSLKMITKLKL